MAELHQSLENEREEYKHGSLLKADADSNPFAQFDQWFQASKKSDTREPYAMALATADSNGQPSMRMVLLRAYDQKGFVFYTNYLSRKGKELAENPLASLLFFWESQERQIRLEGKIEKVSEKMSQSYFEKRPFKSQVGAVASNQSEVIESRKELEEKFDALLAVQEGRGSIDKPEHWGGYRLVPHYFEFWQGRRSRLHDRICYKQEGSDWKIERLAP